MSEAVDVVATCAFFLKNLDALTRKEKLPTPLSQYPIRFEVYSTHLSVVEVLFWLRFQDRDLFLSYRGAIRRRELFTCTNRWLQQEARGFFLLYIFSRRTVAIARNDVEL